MPGRVTSWVLASVSVVVIAASFWLAVQPGAAEAQTGFVQWINDPPQPLGAVLAVTNRLFRPLPLTVVALVLFGWVMFTARGRVQVGGSQGDRHQRRALGVDLPDSQAGRRPKQTDRVDPRVGRPRLPERPERERLSVGPHERRRRPRHRAVAVADLAATSRRCRGRRSRGAQPDVHRRALAHRRGRRGRHRVVVGIRVLAGWRRDGPFAAAATRRRWLLGDRQTTSCYLDQAPGVLRRVTCAVLDRSVRPPRPWCGRLSTRRPPPRGHRPGSARRCRPARTRRPSRRRERVAQAGEDVPDRDREGGRRGRVTRGERGGPRHRHPSALGHTEQLPVGARALTGELHRLVHQERRYGDGCEAGRRCPTPPAAADGCHRPPPWRAMAWRSWRTRTRGAAGRPATVSRCRSRARYAARSSRPSRRNWVAAHPGHRCDGCEVSIRSATRSSTGRESLGSVVMAWAAAAAYGSTPRRQMPHGRWSRGRGSARCSKSAHGARSSPVLGPSAGSPAGGAVSSKVRLAVAAPGFAASNPTVKGYRPVLFAPWTGTVWRRSSASFASRWRWSPVP